MSGILRATERNDLPALAKFLVRVYKFEPSDFHADPRLLEWKYLYPRAGWEGGRSYILERDGSIAAHGGVCPVSFRLPTGQTVRGHVICDWAADSTMPGLGVMMYRKLMQTAPTSFAIGGAPVTRKILPRIGFRHVGEAPTYAAWLRPWQEFRERSRTGRSLLRLLHGLAHPVPNRSHHNERLEFVPVNQFDDSIQPILSGAKRRWTFCERTVADLNYLLKCPHLEMRGFMLRRAAGIIGYFILGKSGWEGRVLDIAIDSEDLNVWTDAYSAVTNAALLDHEICRIRALSTVPMLNQALLSNGYWCQYKAPIVLYDPADAMGQAFPLSFQYFDGDWGY
jgi:Acetyltransferase (GNAT) domain